MRPDRGLFDGGPATKSTFYPKKSISFKILRSKTDYWGDDIKNKDVQMTL